MVNEQVELNELIDSPAARHLWLLHRALQFLPLDRAIERPAESKSLMGRVKAGCRKSARPVCWRAPPKRS
jgi:hypothetical protein